MVWNGSLSLSLRASGLELVSHTRDKLRCDGCLLLDVVYLLVQDTHELNMVVKNVSEGPVKERVF